MDVWTLIALVGIAAIAVGVGMLSLPAGVIAAGVALFALAVAGAARRAYAARGPRPEEPYP